MPDIELIKSIQDREFTSGLGNWTGQCDWQDGPILSRQGVLHVEMPPGTTLKQFQLQYPAFKALPEVAYNLSFVNYGIIVSGQIAWLGLSFSDGVYEAAGTLFEFGTPGTWRDFTCNLLPPLGWNPNTALLKIKVYSLGDYLLNSYFDNFSILYYSAARLDHLMLMGVH